VLRLLVGKRLAPDLVPDGLWEIVEPLLPPQTERPQGGGTRYVEDRAVFTDRLRADHRLRLAAPAELTIRYERSAGLFTAFLTTAATLTCYKKLTA
jgi:hypothetical protein